MSGLSKKASRRSSGIRYSSVCKWASLTGRIRSHLGNLLRFRGAGKLPRWVLVIQKMIR